MGRAPFSTTGKYTLKKGAWTPDEDQKLVTYIKSYGIWIWNEMPGPAGLLRTGKSCRLRWMNYLRPGIKRGNFSKQEEETIIKLHEQLGNKWSAIAASLPGRTDNEIKNYWHSSLKKRLKPNELKASKKSTAIIESNQQHPSEIETIDHVLNSLNATKLEDCNTIPLPGNNSAVYNIDQSQAINKNFGGSCEEAFDELQRLWELPISMAMGGLCMEQNQEGTYTDPAFIAPSSPVWIHDYFYSPYIDASYDFSWVNILKQQNIDNII